MRRGALLAALAGLCLLATGTWLSFEEDAKSTPRRHLALDTGKCVVPMTVMGYADSQPAIVVFHGLSANRVLMSTLARRLRPDIYRIYLVDLPGHGDSNEPFSFAGVDACAASLLETLEKGQVISPEITALVGHSMGGAIAMRMADVLPVAATVAISPAPLTPSEHVRPELVFFSPPRRMPGNLLVAAGSLEPRLARDNAEDLVRRAGGQRTSAEDFQQRRAAASLVIPGASHVSLIFHPQMAREALEWIRKGFGAEAARAPADISLFPLFGPALGFLGLLLLFPASATAFVGSPGERQSPQTSMNMLSGLIAWAVVAAATVAFLRLAVPLGPIVRMYGGAYLASVLMLSGIVLMLWLMRTQPDVSSHTKWNVRPALGAAALGFLTILAFGGWLNWQIADGWLNTPRWWRFFVLLPALLPYLLAEELALGLPSGKNPASKVAGYKSNALRFLLFLGLRSAIWLAIAGAIFLLGSREILLLLLVFYLFVFSIFQRLAMDAVRRRTGSAAAAAILGAILGAWFVAAVFPLT